MAFFESLVNFQKHRPCCTSDATPHEGPFEIFGFDSSSSQLWTFDSWVGRANASFVLLTSLGEGIEPIKASRGANLITFVPETLKVLKLGKVLAPSHPWLYFAFLAT